MRNLYTIFPVTIWFGIEPPNIFAVGILDVVVIRVDIFGIRVAAKK
jgi:hypothetical protein